MKILVESDVFDINERIKDIDEDYYILFDISKERYELHHKKQLNSYCFSYPYKTLDNRLIDLIYVSSINNIDKIIEEIDKNNIEIENNIMNKNKDLAGYKFHEIYNFANNSSKEFDSNLAFTNNWR